MRARARACVCVQCHFLEHCGRRQITIDHRTYCALPVEKIKANVFNSVATTLHQGQSDVMQMKLKIVFYVVYLYSGFTTFYDFMLCMYPMGLHLFMPFIIYNAIFV